MTNLYRQPKGRWTTPKYCPECEDEYYGPGALSRKDNKTEICPECGVREALQAAADEYGMELV